MPRDASERPARRLDAILARLRAHRVQTFRAASLPGIGEGIEFTFAPEAPPAEQPEVPARQVSHHRRWEPERPEPIDELDLVAEGREGPIPS